MNEGMISKRYAKALLQFASERGSEDVVFAEMNKFAAAFAGEPRLRATMDNPTLTINDKLTLIKAVVDNKPSDTLVRFVELVLKNKREAYLRNIALSYTDLYCESKHINKGRLVTAAPADKATIDRMKGLLHQIKPGTLYLETSVDPDIEGGFILYVDTYRLDASVKNQLRKIKQQLIVENSKVS